MNDAPLWLSRGAARTSTPSRPCWAPSWSTTPRGAASLATCGPSISASRRTAASMPRILATHRGRPGGRSRHAQGCVRRGSGPARTRRRAIPRPPRPCSRDHPERRGLRQAHSRPRLEARTDPRWRGADQQGIRRRRPDHGRRPTRGGAGAVRPAGKGSAGTRRHGRLAGPGWLQGAAAHVRRCRTGFRLNASRSCTVSAASARRRWRSRSAPPPPFKREFLGEAADACPVLGMLRRR